MSKANATVSADAAKASSVAHPPATMIQLSPEEDTAVASTFMQRSVSALGAGNPQTPPQNFASALGHLQGSPSLQTSILRKLQRSYGNSYMGGVIQAKLTVNQPGDIYEQEADRVADMVMRMLDAEVAGILHGTNGIQRTCAACASGQGLCPQCAEEERLQRKPLAATITPLIQREGEGAANHTSQVTPQLAASIEALRGSGQPLPPSVRAFFEPRFGVDFSGVRLHTDARATQLARSVNAQAFTVGQDVVFGADEYAPESMVGKRLLAHELTHVVQQSNNYQIQTNIIQKSCDNDFTNTVPEGCRGTIDVRAGETGLGNISVFHLFIVFTDSIGTAYGLRGGPSLRGNGYGNIITDCDLYRPGFRDYDESAPSVRVYEGEDTCQKARLMKEHLDEISDWNIPYSPNGPNSNSVIASLLRHAGLPMRKPNVAAPGFDVELTAEGPRDLPGLLDRRQRVFIILHSRDDATLALGYSQDFFETHGISFPIILGAEYSLNTQSLLGNVGSGVEVPAINIPTPTLMPTHFRFSGGIVAGIQEGDPGTDRLDTLVGGFFQAQFGFDISNFRMSSFLRFDYLHNLETGRGSGILSSWGMEFGLAL